VWAGRCSHPSLPEFSAAPGLKYVVSPVYCPGMQIARGDRGGECNAARKNGRGRSKGDINGMSTPKIGTCSWKFDSWVGLVYTHTGRTAAQYLGEYSARYRTAEIDSWFYRMPARRTVLDYLDNVDEDFRFTCKLPMAISLTHHRKRKGAKELEPNPDFLSAGLMLEFLEATRPMAGRLDAVMLQFEYLSREKMPSLGRFLEALEGFAEGVPRDVPLTIERLEGMLAS